MVSRKIPVLFALCMVAVISAAPPVERRGSAKIDVDKYGNKTGEESEGGGAGMDEVEQNVKQQIDGQDVSKPKKQPDLVRRPDHLDAVPLERDGHLNKQFRQEILFGETNKEKMNGTAMGKELKYDEKMSAEEKEMLLIETFHKADTNSNGYLTSDELEKWIQQTTLRHLDDAVKETKTVMQVVDQNGDGYATWDEYHYHFLVDNRLMDPNKARKHDENHADLSQDDQEKIETEIEEWHEADRNPKDGQLSQQEFLAFRHPEHSEVMLNEMVKDILRSLDADNDGRLTEDEFVAVPKGELVDKRWEETEKRYLLQRRKEFKELIDLDHDGYVNFKELLQYTNPRNIQHAKREVRELMELGDENKDGKLSLDEVLQQRAAFLGSKLINTDNIMHDEF